MSFEPNKNAKQLGIDTTKEFRVVRKTDVDPCYSNGDILTLKKDYDFSYSFFTNKTSGFKGVYIDWSELEYADRPTSKFKVGDRVRRINKPNGLMQTGDTGEITSIRQDVTDWLTIKLDKTGDIDTGHNAIYFELLTPTLINQIITDIKDQDQANRIGKKLDSMGYSLVFNIKWSKDTHIIIKVNKNSLYSPFIFDNEPSWPHITANEFLGEEEILISGDTEMVSSSGVTAELIWCGVEEANLQLKRNKLTNQYNTPTTPSSAKGKNIMSNIVNFAKDLLLSAEEKLLRKYGLHDENSNNTSEARQLINDKIYNSPENQAYLLEVAVAKQADEKANK